MLKSFAAFETLAGRAEWIYLELVSAKGVLFPSSITSIIASLSSSCLSSLTKQCSRMIQSPADSPSGHIRAPYRATPTSSSPTACRPLAPQPHPHHPPPQPHTLSTTSNHAPTKSLPSASPRENGTTVFDQQRHPTNRSGGWRRSTN
jgi:hypothetical protein